MGNLGVYQLMTTVAKKVGGPGILLVGIAVGGYVVIRTAEGGIKTGIKKVRKYLETKSIVSNNSKLYSVYKYGECNEGLIFNTGDTYKVLEKDGDSVLIEKIGNANNPYFVSSQLLREISDYED